MFENDLAKEVIGIAIDVHKTLGPGLLENVYKECLYYKLTQAGYCVEKEKIMPVFFEEIQLDCGYRIDLLVENSLLIELKSVNEISNVHIAQTITYLKLGDYKLGLLINFNVFRLRDGIRD